MKISHKLSISIFAFMIFFPLFFIRSIQFDNSVTSYVPTKEEYVKNYFSLRNIFGNDETFVFLFKNEDILEPEFIKKLSTLYSQVESLEFVDKVYSIFSLEYMDSHDNEIHISPVVDMKRFQDFPRSYWYNRLQKSKQAKGLVVTKNFDGISLTILAKKGITTPQAQELRTKIYSLFTSIGVKNYLKAEAGSLNIDVESYEMSFYDLAKFSPLTIIVGLLLIWSFFPIITPLLVAIVSIIATSSLLMGIYGFLDIPFNIISTMVPTLMMAIGVAFIIHLFNSLKNYSNQGLSIDELYKKSCAHIRRPVLYTALTTAIGFSSLALSEIPPIRHFALISAFGVVLVCFTVLYLVPPILQWRKIEKWNFQNRSSKWLDAIVFGFLRFSVRNAIAILVASTLLLVIFGPSIKNIRVETDLLKFFSDDHPSNIGTTLIQNELTGTSLFEVVLSSDQIDLFKDVAQLRKIRAFQSKIEEHSAVDRSISYIDFVEELNKTFQGEQIGLAIPSSNELLAQYLFVYDGEDMWDFIDEDFQTARIQLNLTVHEASKIVEVRKYIESEFNKHNLPFKMTFSGMSHLFAMQEELLVRGQIKTLWVSVLLIAFVMFLQWRRIDYTILTMIPNVLPIVAIFIVMAIFGHWLDMGTALIASVTVGIAVDDTIHLFENYRINYTKSPIFALVKTYHHAGRAIVITTIILCSQFLILSISGYIPIRSFGLLTALGLFIALLADLVLLPAILVVTHMIKNRRKGENYVS